MHTTLIVIGLAAVAMAGLLFFCFIAALSAGARLASALFEMAGAEAEPASHEDLEEEEERLDNAAIAQLIRASARVFHQSMLGLALTPQDRNALGYAIDKAEERFSGLIQDQDAALPQSCEQDADL